MNYITFCEYIKTLHDEEILSFVLSKVNYLEEKFGLCDPSSEDDLSLFSDALLNEIWSDHMNMPPQLTSDSIFIEFVLNNVKNIHLPNSKIYDFLSIFESPNEELTKKLTTTRKNYYLLKQNEDAYTEQLLAFISSCKHQLTVNLCNLIKLNPSLSDKELFKTANEFLKTNLDLLSLEVMPSFEEIIRKIINFEIELEKFDEQTLQKAQKIIDFMFQNLKSNNRMNYITFCELINASEDEEILSFFLPKIEALHQKFGVCTDNNRRDVDFFSGLLLDEILLDYEMPVSLHSNDVLIKFLLDNTYYILAPNITIYNFLNIFNTSNSELTERLTHKKENFFQHNLSLEAQSDQKLAFLRSSNLKVDLFIGNLIKNNPTLNDKNLIKDIKHYIKNNFSMLFSLQALPSLEESIRTIVNLETELEKLDPKISQRIKKIIDLLSQNSMMTEATLVPAPQLPRITTKTERLL